MHEQRKAETRIPYILHTAHGTRKREFPSLKCIRLNKSSRLFRGKYFISVVSFPQHREGARVPCPSFIRAFSLGIRYIVYRFRMYVDFSLSSETQTCDTFTDRSLWEKSLCEHFAE